jgi:plastocyanin
MKDKEGKEETKTLTLTNDVKIVDAKDKAATLDSIKVGDEVTLTHRDGKLVEIEREHAKGTAGTAKKGHKHEATITKVDAKNGTVTVQMKDKNGKEIEKTFTLTGESRYLDSTGREAAMDVFQSGNEVLVVEEQGKLVQMQQKDKKSGEKKVNPK